MAGSCPSALANGNGSYVQVSRHSLLQILTNIPYNFKFTLVDFLPGAALGINPLIRQLMLSVFLPSTNRID